MKRVLLIILDGFGVRADQDFNSVSHAKKPYLDKLMHEYASGTIYASEEYVGLPKGQFGNSEVGHLNLGAGRIIRQDIMLLPLRNFLLTKHLLMLVLILQLVMYI